MVRPAGTWEDRKREHLSLRGRGKVTPAWRLKWWRLEREMSQVDAAERLGCSQPSLAEFELGHREPHGDIREQIESRTGVRWS